MGLDIYPNHIGLDTGYMTRSRNDRRIAPYYFLPFTFSVLFFPTTSALLVSDVLLITRGVLTNGAAALKQLGSLLL